MIAYRSSTAAAATNRPRIVIVTTNAPGHQRLEGLIRVFRDFGSVELSHHRASGMFGRFLNLLISARNVDLAGLRAISRIRHADIVILQNTQMFFLAPLARLLGKRVAFDALDVYPQYNSYFLEKKYPALKMIWRLQGKVWSHIERALAARFAERVFCNSRYLQRYFSPNSVFAPYFSLLRPKFQDMDMGLSSALLYIGNFSRDKGGDESIAIAARLEVPLFVIGKCPREMLDLARKRGVDLAACGELDLTDMQATVDRLRKRHFLWGLSLLRSDNPSYAVQEANKDTDYISLGIPILGNDRSTTYEKIERGAGVLITDLGDHLPDSEQDRTRLTKACQVLTEDYSEDAFRAAVLPFFRSESSR